MELKDLYKAIENNRRIIFLFVLISAGISYWISSSIQPVYKSEGLLKCGYFLDTPIEPPVETAFKINQPSYMGKLSSLLRARGKDPAKIVKISAVTTRLKPHYLSPLQLLIRVYSTDRDLSVFAVNVIISDIVINHQKLYDKENKKMRATIENLEDQVYRVKDWIKKQDVYLDELIRDKKISIEELREYQKEYQNLSGQIKALFDYNRMLLPPHSFLTYQVGDIVVKGDPEYPRPVFVMVTTVLLSFIVIIFLIIVLKNRE